MRLIHLVIVVSLFIIQLGSPAALAQDAGETATWQGIWNGADLTVVVVARGHRIPENVRQTQPWWRWGNTTTDAYLFIFTADRYVDLVVDFSMEAGHPKATLYAPFVQAQRESIQIGQGSYTPPANLPPSVVLWPRQGDWLIDGKANFNLDGLEIDPTTDARRWQVRVGAEKPGVPRWVVRTLLDDPYPDRGYPRFYAAVHADETTPYELAPPFMPSWPYLSVKTKEPHYGKNQPVFFDPYGRTISTTWVGFHTAGMYQVNSLAYPPKTDFEAPFAFYRFDPDAGRYPNMVIRSDVWPKGDHSGPPISSVQRTALRMTWTGKQPDLWRYSLTVIGNYPMDEQVVIGNTAIQAVSYWNYPHWVASKPWKAVTFVEATQGETGSEGIYDYSVEDNYPVSFWVNGLQDQPPDNYQAPYLSYPHIDPRRLKDGFRGEYSMVYNRVPALYFSPIDNRAHLLYAQEGVWNLGSRRVLRMHNLSGGPYIDGWTRERVPQLPAGQSNEPPRALPGHVEEALYALDGYLIYSGPGGTELRQAAYQHSSFGLTPPTDKASWQRFQEQLAPYQPRDPNDLKSWLQYFPGKASAVAGAQISEVRAIPNGFRFVLDLQPGFQAQRSDLFHVDTLAPGRYVVMYDGTFTITPLTPPALSASLVSTALPERAPGAVRITLRNDGLQDLASATLELWAAPPQGQATLVTTQTVALLARIPITPTLTWTPPKAGRWTLTPKIRQPDGRLVTLTSGQIMVQPAPATTPEAVIMDSVSHSVLPSMLLVLILLAGIAAQVFWRQFQTLHGEELDDRA